MRSKILLAALILPLAILPVGNQSSGRVPPREDLAGACVAGLEWYVRHRRPGFRNSGKYLARKKWCRCFQRVISANPKFDQARVRILADGILYPIRNPDAKFDPDSAKNKPVFKQSVPESSYAQLLGPSACDKKI